MAVSKRHLKRRHIEPKLAKLRHDKRNEEWFEGTSITPYKGAFGGIKVKPTVKQKANAALLKKTLEQRAKMVQTKDQLVDAKANKDSFFTKFGKQFKKYKPW